MTSPSDQSSAANPNSAEAFELGQFIPLHYHHVMLLDDARLGAFRESITKLVAPGAKVVELGGGTGVLSWIAAQRAAKVWYVERNPELYRFAGQVLPLNAGHERIELVNADGASFVPPERVDVVICEMLHVGMLREKQIEVIEGFKRNYLAKFGAPLPRFIPEAAYLALQPVQQNYLFDGYRCPIPLFEDPGTPQPRTTPLGEGTAYSFIEYRNALPNEFSWNGRLAIAQAGTVNALRFATKNIIGVFIEENRCAEWYSSHLVVPLRREIAVRSGDEIHVSFKYTAGGPIEELVSSLEVVSGSQGQR